MKRREEAGASFAVEVHGESVVDLWGGKADRATGAKWGADTAAVIYSGTKGLAAMCLLRLWDQGRLDDELPVSHYWPEFGAGKEGVTVRQAISHLGGFPGLRDPYTFDELIDMDVFADKVAKEPPFWRAGTQIAYHAKTWGTVVGQLVRRIDGRPIGRFFAEEFAEPLGLDIWLGIPPELESRVAPLERGDVVPPDFGLGVPGMPKLPPDLLEVFRAILYDPPADDGAVNWNSLEAHRSQVPSSGAIATARSIAHLYSALCTDGVVDGIRVLSPAAARRATTVFSRGRPLLSDYEVRFGPGFQLGEIVAPPIAPDISAVGHGGVGGSLHGAWPELGVSYSFVMNRLLMIDDRAYSLLDRTYAALAEVRGVALR